MTKEEKIEEAYGIHWKIVRDSIIRCGWVQNKKFQHLLPKDLFEFYVSKHTSDNNLMRPKELDGIEDNNGWIKIESEADFDKIPNGDYHWFNIDNWEYESGDIPVNKYTHFQQITKPNPPIY